MAALRARPAAWIAAVLLLAAEPVTAAPRVEQEIPYAFTAGGHATLRRQSFDLYLPEATTRPPLVVFVHGGFWVESDDNYQIGPRVARLLAADGAAVALVRYRLSPAVRHPNHVLDVAAALAALKRLAPRYGYDAKRIYLVGHSAGATLAALLALEPRYLRERGLQPADVAGAVLISGIYDLGPAGPLASRHAPILNAAFGPEPAARRAASPVAFARAGPPLLVLAAAADAPGFAIDARRFVRTVRAAGSRNVQEAIIPDSDHFTIVDFNRSKLVRALIGAFVGLKPLDPQTAALMQLRSRWHQPPFSTEPFWKADIPVRSYPVDERFRAALRQIFEQGMYELNAYPLQQYHAIDLLDYVASLPPERIGRGDYLIVTNVRGQRLYLTRKQLQSYRPRLVIGLDDERNLFRLNVFYQNRREYSWRPETPPIMARPVGGFIHMPDAPPGAMPPDTLAPFALTADSFRFAETDPLAAVRDLSPEVRTVLVESNACLGCHSFRGAGARAGHVEAARGTPHGGFALAFEAYPAQAWRRFIFEPEAAARIMGVRPNPVEGAQTAKKLYELVVAERERKSSRR